MANLTLRQVAAQENVSPDTVKRALRFGRLRGHKIGARGDWRITEEDAAAWVASGCPTQKATNDDDDESDRAEASANVSE